MTMEDLLSMPGQSDDYVLLPRGHRVAMQGVKQLARLTATKILQGRIHAQLFEEHAHINRWIRNKP